MFCRCNSLISLPDISKWNTNNITDMNHMFDKCISLSSLPDISKWNTNNVTNMRDMFEECLSLMNSKQLGQEISKKHKSKSGFHNCCVF